MSKINQKYALFFILLAVALSTLIFLTARTPNTNLGYIGLKNFRYSLDLNHQLMGIVTGLTAIGLFVSAFWYGKKSPSKESKNDSKKAKTDKLKYSFYQKLGHLFLVFFIAFASFLYFYGDRGLNKKNFPKFWDSYHYFIGAKYYDELGYNQFYSCHLVVDSTRPEPKYFPGDSVRDLKSYQHISVHEVIQKTGCTGFSAARWQEYRSDMDFFDQYISKDTIRDRGYNGTPFHSFLAKHLARIVPVNYTGMLVASFIDIFAICAMFALIAWAFGWQTASLSALFFFTNFADRFVFIGASFIRYIWLFSLIAGLCFMKKNRHKTAGVFIAASAMMNVFPVLFFAGISIKIIINFLRQKKILDSHKKFLLGSILGGLVFFSLSLLHAHPIENYRVFIEKMKIHSPIMTESRIGFKFNFLYRGEVTAKDRIYSYDKKARDIEKIKWEYLAVVTLIVLFGLAVASRLDDISATALSGFLLFFMLFTTVEYYYAVAVVLIVMWHQHFQTKSGKIMLALLFALMSTAFIFWDKTGFLKFLNNTVLSAIFTIYLLASLIYLLFKSVPRRHFSAD